MHKKGKYRTGRTGYDQFWTVVSDYTNPACSDSKCTDQWGKESDAALWNGDPE